MYVSFSAKIENVEYFNGRTIILVGRLVKGFDTDLWCEFSSYDSYRRIRYGALFKDVIRNIKHANYFTRCHHSHYPNIPSNIFVDDDRLYKKPIDVQSLFLWHNNDIVINAKKHFIFNLWVLSQNNLKEIAQYIILIGCFEFHKNHKAYAKHRSCDCD